MIEHLYIKNVALIDEVSVDFNEGLNILSGETGSGKSIIIDSINFVLGERASRDFIHKECDSAFVEMIVGIRSENVRNALSELGAETDEENNILLGRTINSKGKSICKINGKPVTVGMMKEVSSLLADIHGQHEHQSLLDPKRHIVLLDKFCSEKLDELKEKLAEETRQYRTIMKKMTDIVGSGDKEKQSVYLKYQLEEIERAELKNGEEEELNKRYSLLTSTEKLKLLCASVLNELKRAEGSSAEERISVALKKMYEIEQVDEDVKEICEQLETVSSLLYDVINSVSDYNDSVEYDPMELRDIEERLDMIYSLKRKYVKSSTDELIEFAKELRDKLSLIENSEADLQRLTEEKSEREKKIRHICDEMTKERTEAARKIEERIINSLKDLGMKDARFKIVIEKKPVFNSNGRDKVEFMISANLGEELKPLAKIASGGEMSRVMLSMKAVLADADDIETFIFDEIDTGVSGRTAQQVAEKLAYISKNNQILCITHLPQIASMGDSNYLIEKTSDEKNTRTSIKEITGEDINKELARLIGGAEITENTMTAADEMKKQAAKIKTEERK